MNIQLLNLLKSNHQGEDRAIKRRLLAQVIYTPKAGQFAPWTDKDIKEAERELRNDITELNEEGYPVLSGQSGIFYSEEIDEIEGWARFYKEMGISNIKKADALDKIAQELRDKKQGILYPTKPERIYP